VLLMAHTTADPAVRVAGPADDAAVRALLAGAGLPLAGLEDTWRRWVAESGHGIEGAVAMERHAGRDGTVYLLRSLVVRPATRGSGIGGRLVRTALAAADRHEGRTAHVALLTETAVGYFERFGFVATGRDALSTALAASAEFTGACPASAAAYVRA
jgi:amino-acid N-acetyltransferase